MLLASDVGVYVCMWGRFRYSERERWGRHQECWVNLLDRFFGWPRARTAYLKQLVWHTDSDGVSTLANFIESTWPRLIVYGVTVRYYMAHRLVTFAHKFNFIGILLNIKNITAEDNYCAGNRELHVPLNNVCIFYHLHDDVIYPYTDQWIQPLVYCGLWYMYVHISNTA